MSVGVVLLLPHPVDSRLRGNDGPGKVGLGCWHPALWILDQVRNNGVSAYLLLWGCLPWVLVQ